MKYNWQTGEETQEGYCLYAHINPKDNRTYIGISKNIKQRWAAKAEAYSSSPLIYRALKEIGWDNFIHLPLYDKLTLQEARVQEKLWIKAFKSIGLSYNKSDGGEFMPSVIRSEEVRLKQRNAMLGRHPTADSRHKMSKAHTNESKPWKWREVYAFNKDTKEFVKKYDSITKAATELNLQVAAITNSAKGKCPSAGLYIWSYTPTIDKQSRLYSKMNYTAVYCYNLNGTFYKEYNSIKEAAEAVNGNVHCISNCCTGRAITHNGYIWRKTLQEIEPETLLKLKNKNHEINTSVQL